MVSLLSLLILVVAVDTSNGDPTYSPVTPDDDACPMISKMSCPAMSLPGSDDVIQLVPKRLPDADYRLPDHPEMDGIKLKLICAEPDCLSNPCQNGGTCKETYDGYKCLCSSSYTGTNCEAVVYGDCTEIFDAGERTSGVYEIYPRSDVSADQEPISVYCNMDETPGGSGGWLVFQHRYDGSVDFYRDWADYKDGFGNLETEFWLGNEAIHRITLQGVYELRIDMVAVNGKSWRAMYDNFRLADESDGYRLNLEYKSWNSNVSNALSVHNGRSFTTRDRDNDLAPDENCALQYRGGWWYKYCHHCNLNGLWSRADNKGMRWLDGRSELYMRATTMEIKALE